MYSFADRHEAHTMVALRPEGTPRVVRAYIEAGLDRSEPEQRFFYTGPMFRRERPQKGRYRQHYQFGVEIFWRADPACDAELLIMIDDLRRELKLTLETQINSLGCAQCRPAFRAAPLAFGRAHLAELCEDCHARLERNPIRLLDCKIDTKLMESAPSSLDYLCEACRKHFDTVIDLIKSGGVPYAIKPAPGARPRLLYADHFRGGLVIGRRSEHRRRGRQVRRAGRIARRRAGAADRLGDRPRSRGAGSGGLRRRPHTCDGGCAYRAGRRGASHGDAPGARPACAEPARRGARRARPQGADAARGQDRRALRGDHRRQRSVAQRRAAPRLEGEHSARSSLG